MYPSSLPNIDLQVLPTFPANVVATGGVDISKSGLTYTFGLNFQNVAEETNISDMSKREVLVQDTDTGAFWRVKLSSLPTGQSDWANIQNKPATFPPSPHTHPVAEISDATVIGRNLVIAADAAAAWAALGTAGVSATTGYTKLPSGLIIQWGVVTSIGSDGGATFTFPIAFPNNRFALLASASGPWVAPPYAPIVYTSWENYKTSGTVWCRDHNGSVIIGGNVHWIAIGN